MGNGFEKSGFGTQRGERERERVEGETKPNNVGQWLFCLSLTPSLRFSPALIFAVRALRGCFCHFIHDFPLRWTKTKTKEKRFL